MNMFGLKITTAPGTFKAYGAIKGRIRYLISVLDGRTAPRTAVMDTFLAEVRGERRQENGNTTTTYLSISLDTKTKHLL